MRDGVFLEVPWSKLQVGDIIKITRNGQVPADAVFLSSFAADSDTPDTCYVQTAQLDGETNLKLRAAVAPSVARFKSDADCASFRGHIICEPPNAAFDKFVGLLHLDDVAQAASVNSSFSSRGIPLEADQLLLRGAFLRNVDYAYAMITYTGRETKVRVRQTNRPKKVAQVESELNRLIMLIIALLVTLCLTGTIAHTIWTNYAYGGHWYLLQKEPLTVKAGVLQFFTYFLLNAAFIPISLYVSVRLVRSIQVYFMESDKQMLHEDEELIKATHGEEGSFPLKVRNMELNDELGQITHIFSDKTGTLTLNYMEWRKILVNGVSHGLGTTQIGIDRLRREGHDVSSLVDALAAEKMRGRERGAQLPHVNFEDGSDTHPGRTIGRDSRNPCDNGQGAAINDMLLHLTLNHTVLPEIVRNASGVVTGARLSAASPDEEAFCYAAETLGYKFVSRTHDGVVIKIRHAPAQMPLYRLREPLSPTARVKSGAVFSGVRTSGADAFPGTEYPFRILHVLAYSQERKRMSVIVEQPALDVDGNPVLTGAALGEASEGGEIVLFCKGADSVIFPRCVAPRTPQEVEALETTKSTLASWGGDGLRTLVFAQRRISRDEFAAWNAQYSAATSSLEELRKRKDKRPNAIEDLQDKIENGLTLQGAMANEDKLQPEVPETIAQLAKAGIKIWMVTGDKQETAINIGFATKLLTESQRQIISTMESAGGVNAAMKRLRVAAKRMRYERAADAAAEQNVSHLGAEGISTWVEKQLAIFQQNIAGNDSVRGGDRVEIDINAVAAQNAGLSPARRTTTSTSQPALSSPVPASPGLSSMSAPQDGFDSDEEENTIACGSDDLAETLIGAHVPTPLSSPSGASGRFNPTSVPNLMRAAPGGAVVSGNPVYDVMRAGATPVAPLLGGTRRPFALVIDEHCLDAALSHPRTKAYLLYVSYNCDAVVACRARPDQKAQVVRLIRNGISTSRTLAVGDGANDVDMISNAHVGVGIAGAEGVQAANASDFSIGRFRFLQRLLLVHGRWNYSRMARVVLLMFWKNILIVLCQFIFQTYNGFSGQKWYVEYAAQVYNLLFTGLPPIVMGVYDRDLDAEWALRFPKLYEYGRTARGLRTQTFLLWMADAIITAIIFFFFTIYGYTRPDGNFNSGKNDGVGTSSYVFQTGSLAFSMVVVAASIRVAVESYQHAYFVQIAIAVSAIIWLPAAFIFDLLKQDGMLGGMRYIFGSANFWLALGLATGVMGARLLAWKAWKRLYAPELRHIVEEIAAFNLDTRSVVDYTEAADLARRTGKPISQVLRADSFATAAAQVIVSTSGDTSSRVVNFMSTSPVKGGGSVGGMYATLSGGETPDDKRKLLSPSALTTPMPKSASADERVDQARKLILEGAFKPRIGAKGDDDFDSANDYENSLPTPTALSPVVVVGGAAQRAGGDFSDAVSVADMKAQLSAGIENIRRIAVAGPSTTTGSSMTRPVDWPPGSTP